LLGLSNQAPQKATGITAGGFFLPLFLPKRQRTATSRQSFDTNWQVKAGTRLAAYPVFASVALISFKLLMFIHYRS
jgi:hypothetical protein